MEFASIQTKPAEWNSRLYKQNPPTRVEETGRMEFPSIQTKPADAG
jgi:hypothetical protein